MTLLGFQVLIGGSFYGLIMYLIGSEVTNRMWLKKRGSEKYATNMDHASNSSTNTVHLHGLGLREQIKRSHLQMGPISKKN
ncbi:hypothetical protein [Listeria grayi]|uniref:hypothetical protein n=1 Tax=Listeria grayi TaxID=1641 RepID=UPI0016261AD4|nr:hypothetical protein [Listeria grayi]MBC1921955.1 hypothetical protein [Listeria grayi]